MMKLLRRFLIGICLVVFTAVVALGLGALVPRPLFVSNPVMEVAQSSADKRRILILNNPIHTDIALPADPDVLEAFDLYRMAGWSWIIRVFSGLLSGGAGGPSISKRQRGAI